MSSQPPNGFLSRIAFKKLQPCQQQIIQRKWDKLEKVQQQVIVGNLNKWIMGGCLDTWVPDKKSMVKIKVSYKPTLLDEMTDVELVA